MKFYDLWSIDKCWLRWKEYETSHTFKRKTVDLSRSYSVCSWTGIEPPHLHSHSLRGERQANDWQSMTCKFIQATMKLATKTCNLFCASYHSRIKSILQCNKSSFCRLHKAVELLTNFCNNFSQPATIWFVARQVWPMGGINRCCWRPRTQQSGDRTFARHLNNGTQYPKFGPVSALVSN